MGILGLLPPLKPLISDKHISAFKGKRVAVDGYAWLHKAAYGCCVDLCLGKENNSWIKYCLHFIDMLLSFDIHVYLVFDGAELPAKRVTEVERAANRDKARQLGVSLHQTGDKNGARIQFSRAVDITPRMAAQLIKVLRTYRSGANIDFVVAPYEADAQLSRLCLQGMVDAVISEDSDTIPYGCSEVIFKLDKQGGCQHLVLKDLFERENIGFDLRDFQPDMLTMMCVAAGCDYLVCEYRRITSFQFLFLLPFYFYFYFYSYFYLVLVSSAICERIRNKKQL